MEEGTFLVERLVRILNICLRTCKLLLWREGMIKTLKFLKGGISY